MIIRGRADDPEKKEYLLDYDSHGSLEKGKQYFVGDSWGEGKIIKFIDYDSAANPYSYVDTVPEAGKYYSYQVVAVYQPYEPGSSIEDGQSTDFIYSFWNTKKQLLMEQQAVIYGCPVTFIDPSRTFNFSNLVSGLEMDQTNGIGILGNMNITYPAENIHKNVNEDYRCTLIVGEWKPAITDLWKYVLRQMFTDEDDNKSYIFEGTVQEDQSTPEISTDKNVKFEVLWPNIGLVQLLEKETPGEYEVFVKSPFTIDVPNTFNPEDFILSNYFFIRASVQKSSERIDLPETLDITLSSIDSNNNLISHGNHPEEITKRAFVLNKWKESEDSVEYISSGNRLLLMSYKNDNIYGSIYFGDTTIQNVPFGGQTLSVTYCQMVLDHGIAFELGNF